MFEHVALHLHSGHYQNRNRIFVIILFPVVRVSFHINMCGYSRVTVTDKRYAFLIYVRMCVCEYLDRKNMYDERTS